MVEVMHDKPLLSAVEVRRYFKRKYGLDVSYTNAWMGIEKTQNHLYGDNSKSFDQLRWFIEESLRTNPGSKLVLDMDECSNRFKRFFAPFYACIHGFAYCRPMLFVDGTFFKSRYKGQLLAATAIAYVHMLQVSISLKKSCLSCWLKGRNKCNFSLMIVLSNAGRMRTSKGSGMVRYALMLLNRLMLGLRKLVSSQLQTWLI
ncbi:hypothetical protein L1049_011263 [Liquidambar formosana]|uniref:Transposase n=1 Tax=Liquidambar formosana TaxID=63359 RepID=A0AAP0RRF3_LIQFO